MLPGFSADMMMGGTLPRTFTISPAVSGKTIWDLDKDGPLVLTTAGTWSITPGPGFAGVVTLNGGGGGSGGATAAGFSVGSGGNGGNSTFDGMIAQGGRGSSGAAGSGPGTGGAGGTATGGNINTAGAAGTSSGGAGGPSPNEASAGKGGDGVVNTGRSGGGGGGGFTSNTYFPGVLPASSMSLVVGLGGTRGNGATNGNVGAIGKATIT